MGFSFNTEYNAKSMAAMAKAQRKLMKKSAHNFVRGFLWFAIIFASLTYILFWKYLELDTRAVATFIGVLILLAMLYFEDKFRGWASYKSMAANMTKATTNFGEDAYTGVTRLGISTFYYNNIKHIAESDGYFIFFLDKRHGQLFDKSTISGGTAEDFVRFITAKTGLKIKRI